jgi:hypothetical protein
MARRSNGPPVDDSGPTHRVRRPERPRTSCCAAGPARPGRPAQARRPSLSCDGPPPPVRRDGESCARGHRRSRSGEHAGHSSSSPHARGTRGASSSGSSPPREAPPRGRRRARARVSRRGAGGPGDLAPGVPRRRARRGAARDRDAGPERGGARHARASAGVPSIRSQRTQERDLLDRRTVAREDAGRAASPRARRSEPGRRPGLAFCARRGTSTAPGRGLAVRPSCEALRARARAAIAVRGRRRGILRSRRGRGLRGERTPRARVRARCSPAARGAPPPGRRRREQRTSSSDGGNAYGIRWDQRALWTRSTFRSRSAVAWRRTRCPTRRSAPRCAPERQSSRGRRRRPRPSAGSDKTCSVGWPRCRGSCRASVPWHLLQLRTPPMTGKRTSPKFGPRRRWEGFEQTSDSYLGVDSMRIARGVGG